jgi:hypothetical protein
MAYNFYYMTVKCLKIHIYSQITNYVVRNKQKQTKFDRSKHSITKMHNCINLWIQLSDSKIINQIKDV